MEENEIKVYPMEQKNIIFFAPEYLLIDIADEDLETVTKSLVEDKAYINQLNKESVIPISTLFRLEANKKEAEIVVVYEVDNDFQGKSFLLKDGETRDRFLEEIYSHLTGKYSYEITEYSPVKAALAPLSKMAYILLTGGVLTWLAHTSRTQAVIKRTTIIKGYIALFYDLAMRVGPIPVIIVTLLLLCWYSQYVVESYKNPPINMVITKDDF